MGTVVPKRQREVHLCVIVLQFCDETDESIGFQAECPLQENCRSALTANSVRKELGDTFEVGCASRKNLSHLSRSGVDAHRQRCWCAESLLKNSGFRWRDPQSFFGRLIGVDWHALAGMLLEKLLAEDWRKMGEMIKEANAAVMKHCI